MKGNTVKVLDSLIEEVNVLKRKEELLNIILRYYDVNTGNFNVPEKWPNVNRLSKEQLTAIGETPREWLYTKMQELLPENDFDEILKTVEKMVEKKYIEFDWDVVLTACDTFLYEHNVNKCSNPVKVIYGNNLPRAVMDCMVIAYDKNIQAYNNNLGLILNNEMYIILNAYRQVKHAGYIGVTEGDKS